MSIVSTAALLGSCGTFIPVCTLVVALRFYTRRRQNLALLGDDWYMLAALMFFLAFQICVIILVKIQWLGYKDDPVPADQVESQYFLAQKIITSSDLLLILSLGLTKLSALLLYKRIFCAGGTLNHVLGYIITATSAFIACWIVAFSILDGVQSSGYLGSNYLGDGKVKSYPIGNIYIFALFISDLFLDIWVIVLPIPYILQLRVYKTRKLITIAIFLCALTGVAASAIRLENFSIGVQFQPVTISSIGRESGETSLHFFMILECGMMMISINIPVLWVLFREMKTGLTQGFAALASHLSNTKGGPGNTTVRSTPSNPRGSLNTSTNKKGSLDLLWTFKDHFPHDEYSSQASILPPPQAYTKSEPGQTAGAEV